MKNDLVNIMCQDIYSLKSQLFTIIIASRDRVLDGIPPHKLIKLQLDPLNLGHYP